MLQLSPNGYQKPIVVISDTHFGEPLATLGLPTLTNSSQRVTARTVEHLARSLEALGPLDEIILLGDIWEMWNASFSQARRDAEPFFERLCALPVERIVFVPGNHDYHLLVQHVEAEQIACLRRGETPPRRYRTQHIFTDSFLAGLLPKEARHKFLVMYPDYIREIAGQKILFHHGHHLATLQGGDLFASFPMFILRRLEGVGIPSLTREELERGVSIFYEIFYAISLGDRASTRLQAWWTRWQNWKRWWRWTMLGWVRGQLRGSSSVRERGTPQMDIQRFHEAARWLVRLMAAEVGDDFVRPDLMVFGHTHRSGVATVSMPDSASPLHLVNSGCWLVELHKRNTEHVNTLVIIDEHHAGVYKLGAEGLELRDAVRFPVPEEVVWP